MPQSLETIERQLELAKQRRADVEQSLSGKELKKQPKWRNANAACNQLEARISAHQATRGAADAEAAEGDAADDE